MKKRRDDNDQAQDDQSPPAVRDLKHQVGQQGKNATRGARGAVELAYMRGFQGGYEQAIRDQADGCLDPDNALRYSRASEQAGLDRRRIR